MDNNRFDLSMLLMRLVFGGFMVINHGYSKLLKFLNEDPIKFAKPFGLSADFSLALAVFGELVCGALIAIGLLTRLSAIPALVTMLVAAFVIHGDDSFKEMERALLFAAGYVVILLLGPGRYSIDAWWDRRQMV